MVERFEHFSVAIAEISRYCHKLASEELSKYGLKGSHATYLTTLYRYPEGITVPKLCELCSRDKADASRMISILEEKKLIEKQFSGGKKYRVLISLTEEGMIAAGNICQKASLAVEIAGKDLSDEARSVFYESLDLITANLHELSVSGFPE